jgi:hypothetical protein
MIYISLEMRWITVWITFSLVITLQIDNFLPSNYIADSVCKFRNTQIHQITNKYGKLILELCTESQLKIINGRTLGH